MCLANDLFVNDSDVFVFIQHLSQRKHNSVDCVDKILFFINSFLILKIAITLQDLLGMWSSNKDYIILIFLIVR